MSQTKIIKIVFLLLVAGLSFLIWREFDADLNLINSAGAVYILFLTVLSVAIFILSFFVLDGISLFTGFLVFFAVFIFALGFRWEYIVAIFPALAFFSYSLLRIKNSAKNSIKIEFHSAVTRGASSLITCFAVLFAFAAYFHPFNISELQISPKMFSFANSVLTPIMQSQFPFYEKDMILDDLIALMIASSGGVDLKSVKLPKEAQTLIFSKLSELGSLDAQSVMQDPEIQKSIFPELVASVKKNQKNEIAKQRAEFSKRFGVELKGDEKLDELMAKIINSYIAKYAVSYEKFIPEATAVATFLGIKSLGFFLNRFSVLFAWILYRILRSVGVIRMEEVDIKKEKLLI